MKKMNAMKKLSTKFRMRSVFVPTMFTVMVLAGCQSVPNPPTDVTQALDEAIASSQSNKKPTALLAMPADIMQEISQQQIKQSLHQAKQGLLAEKRLQIAANEVEAKAFFAAIVADSAYSVAVHPEVEGKITLNLKDLT